MSIEKLQDELLTINSSIQRELEAEKRGSTRFSRLPGLYAEKSRIERQLAILQEPQDDALAIAKKIVDGNIGHDVIAIARAVREAGQRAQGAVPDAQAAPVGEREALSAFTAWGESVGLSPALQTVGELKAFKAGAEWQARAALSPAREPLDRETIRAVFMRNGFTIKEGQTDLKPYVYAAAEELLQVAHPAREGVREWIPVSERLPSVAQEVIVNSDFDGVTAGFLDSYGEWYAPNSDYKLTRVIAWQLLPAAPALAAGTGQEVEK